MHRHAQVNDTPDKHEHANKVTPNVHQLVMHAKERAQRITVCAVIKPITTAQKRVLLHEFGRFLVVADPQNILRGGDTCAFLFTRGRDVVRRDVC